MKTKQGDRSMLMTQPFIGVPRDFNEADADFRFGTSVAMAALILRRSEGLESARFGDVRALASCALGPDPHGHRAGFVRLLDRLTAGQDR